MTRAAKNTPDAPPKPTVYEISIEQHALDGGADEPSWLPVSEQAGASAHTAIRAWAEKQGDAFTGGRVRAIPKSRITVVPVTVETKRQITIEAP